VSGTISRKKNKVLPKARELKIDFEALGQQILDRKEELKEDGIPADAGMPWSAVPMVMQTRTLRNRRSNIMATKSSHSHSSTGSGSKGKRKVHKVLKEHKEGKLKSSSGKKVESRKQAVAIALSEARRSGAKIPKKKSS
jgi:hypothetical protein